jgi:predicted nucleic-acid-binding protein
MIGIDTNVLVRYVVQDDARQAALANQFIETTLGDDEPGWIASVVLCEFVWVLEAAYGYTRNAIVATLQRLFDRVARARRLSRRRRFQRCADRARE